jgi:Peptidase A4 family
VSKAACTTVTVTAKSLWRRGAIVVVMGLSSLALAPAASAAPVLSPSVISVHVSPRMLPDSGGRVTITAPVKRAKTCQLVLGSSSTLPVTFSHGRGTGCSGGNFSAHVTVGANIAATTETVLFSLVARNSKSSSSRSFRILVAGRPVPVTTTTVPSTTTTTTPIPAPTGLTPLPASMPTSGNTTYNWAGYILAGGPFTAVEGTFNVPVPATSVSCTDLMNQWVGIDGVSDNTILRAGVTSSELNPNTGNCTPGQDYVQPFWDTTPGAATEITDVVVSPGDSITVTIWQTSGTAWALSLTDNTNGQKYSTTLQYTGPGSSAEWIVEAPTDPTLCGQGEDPSAAGICALTPFSAPITVSNLEVAGPVGSATDAVMEQNAGTATPSAISNDSFTVGYTS